MASAIAAFWARASQRFRGGASVIREIEAPMVTHWREPDAFTFAVAFALGGGATASGVEQEGRARAVIGDPVAFRTAAAAECGRIERLWLPLGANLVITALGEPKVIADMFSGTASGTRLLLEQLAADATPDAPVYDNLDQGWALQMTLTPDWLNVLEWDWERAAEPPYAAYRLPRAVVRGAAAEALARFERAHAALVDAAGEDFWSPRW